MIKFFIISISGLLFISSTVYSNSIDSLLKRSIVPIIKVEQVTGRNNWILKYPVGTAFLLADSSQKPARVYLITARHVIEKDSATICLLNFAEKNNPDISSLVRKYVIKKFEWKFHPEDFETIRNEIKYTGYDIAIAEIFLFRVEQDNDILWNKAINIKWLEKNLADYEAKPKIIAFPFVNKFSMEKGLTMGDLEIDSGMNTHRTNNEMLFDKNKTVKNLNEIVIRNPKFRPGYSGGLVFTGNANISVLGMAMGMSEVKNYANDKFCFAYFVRAENLLMTIAYHFKK